MVKVQVCGTHTTWLTSHVLINYHTYSNEHMIQFNLRSQLFMDSHNNYGATQNNENKLSSVCSLRPEFSTLSQGVMGY